MRCLRFYLLFLCGLFLAIPLKAQQNCTPPAIVANAKSSNFFSPEQETILGDLIFQGMATKCESLKVTL